MNLKLIFLCIIFVLFATTGLYSYDIRTDTFIAFDDIHDFDPDSDSFYHVDPFKEFTDYFKSRYGTPGKRPSAEVIEQRCIEDMRQYFAVSADLNNLYYYNVAELWRQHATKRSLVYMHKFAKICFLLSAGCEKDFSHYHPNENTDENGELEGAVVAVWKEISLAWHEIKFGKASKGSKEEAEILIKGMSTTPDFCYSPYALEELLGRYKGKLSIRPAFYKQLFDESFRRDWDCIRLLFKEDIYGREGSVNPLLPSAEELIRMWESDNKIFRQIAEQFFYDYYPDHPYGHKRILEDLKSRDYFRVKMSIGALTKYYANMKNSERKEELYRLLEQRLQSLRGQQDKGLYFSSSEDPKKTKAGIPILISWYLTCMRTRCPEFSQTKIKDLEPHLVWLENIGRQLNDNYLLGGVERAMPFLKKLKEEE